MPLKLVSARYRIIFSWFLALVLGAGVVLTDSQWEKFPILSSLFFAAGCTLVGIASIGRLWCSLYISGYKSNILVMIGPYSMCRNPLYFFSLLGSIGVGLATETLSIPLILLLFFSLYYPRVIRSEESKLLKLHQEKFKSYCRTTPSFFLNLSNLKEPEEYLVRPKIFRKNMFHALWFIWLVGTLEIIQSLHEAGIVPVLFRIY